MNEQELTHQETAEDELAAIDISDSELINVDKNSKKAKKLSRKRARQLLTPKERQALLLKRFIIGGTGLLVGLAILLAIPATRWPLLNTVGFRGDLTVTITSSANGKPIKNATVKAPSGQLAQTDEFGHATFRQLQLGKQVVVVQKPGYGEQSITVVNGLGSTKKTESLKVIGIKLDFDIKHWLTNVAMEGATVTFGEEQGASDKTGRATIVIPPTEEKTLAVEVAAPGFTTKTATAEVDVQSREVSLVSAGKNYFISRRDGKFDLFSSNLDGSDQKKIIEATGKESSDIMQLSVDKTNKRAVLISNRDGKITNGKFVAGVYFIDLEKAVLKKVDEGSDIQLLGWYDGSIVYTRASPAAAYNDPHVSALQLYNAATGKLSTIAEANYFAVALLAQSKVFYAVTDPYNTVDGALTSFDVTSSARKTYLENRIVRYAGWNTYQTLDLVDSAGASFELQIAGGATKAADRKTVNAVQFMQSPNAQQVAWTDVRDGQGTVLIKNVKSNDEKIVAKAAGITNPLRFVGDDLLVARVVTSQETADYVVSVSTGKIAKITDVSNIGNRLNQGL